MTRAATSTIAIGPAAATDVAALAALLGELFVIEADFRPDAEAQRRGLALMLDHPDRFVAAARADGEVVGMGTVQMVISTAQGGPAALVEDIIVARPWRGRGLGRRIVAALEHWAARQGATRLQLLADRDNAPALDFYARIGWTATNLVCLRRHAKGVDAAPRGERP